MSYQFEDESALEELLNQQLDRRKQQPPSVSSSSGVRSVGARSASVQRGAINQSIVERPSTATSTLNKQTTFDESTDAPASKTSEPARGRLASWLETKSSNLDRFEQQGIATANESVEQSRTSFHTIEKYPRIEKASAEQNENHLIETKLTDEYLQDMSKQGLIQMIVEKIVPSIKALRRSIDGESAIQVEKIKSELEVERNKIRLLETKEMEQVKAIEARWIELNKRLELQIESTNRELNDSSNRHKSLMNDLEVKHKEQTARLVESYENRLVEEKRQSEEFHKRQDQFHRLEMESKLKVNWDQVKLETIFQEWQKMIQSTISHLEVQFKSVESLLDKQTIQINGSNTKLADRCKQVVEQYEKFESKGEQMNRLVSELSEILPRFSRIQADNEQLTKQAADRLGEFLTRSDELQTRETDLNRLRNQLFDEREELNKEKLQIGLETNKLVYKEDRLDELVKGAKEMETRLVERETRLDSREVELETRRSSVDNRNGQLRLQNYELHLMRKRLVAKEEELSRLGNELETKKDLICNQLSQVRSEMAALMKARQRAQKELSQLQRLQKSLICSLCLDRLFPNEYHPHEKSNNLKSSTTQIYDYIPLFRKQSAIKRSSIAINETALNRNKVATMAPELAGKEANRSSQDSKSKFEEELSRISNQIKRDERQLQAENKYVELLSAS